jgi:SM-20-related protein
MPLLPAVPYDPATLAATVSERGACLLTGFPDLLATTALRDQLLHLVTSGALRAAEVGHGQGLLLRTEIRGDATRWLDAESGLAATTFLATLDHLRVELNQRLFLCMDEVEAHFACYPVGTFYGRHRDRFHDSDSRVLSLVSYLNQDWLPEHGGALRIYLPEGPADVLPQGGITVCFLSEIEHEVLPASRQRLSIASWMRNRRSLSALGHHQQAVEGRPTQGATWGDRPPAQ